MPRKKVAAKPFSPDKAPAPDVILSMATFVAERDQALLSLDRAKILAYGDKWGVNFNRVPGEEHLFWASVHMARTGAKSLPLEARVESKRWLTERGLRSLDDGDVPALAPQGEEHGNR